MFADVKPGANTPKRYLRGFFHARIIKIDFEFLNFAKLAYLNYESYLHETEIKR